MHNLKMQYLKMKDQRNRTGICRTSWAIGATGTARSAERRNAERGECPECRTGLVLGLKLSVFGFPGIIPVFVTPALTLCPGGTLHGAVFRTQYSVSLRDWEIKRLQWLKAIIQLLRCTYWNHWRWIPCDGYFFTANTATVALLTYEVRDSMTSLQYQSSGKGQYWLLPRETSSDTSEILHQSINKDVGPPYCRVQMYTGRFACCSQVSHGEYANRQTDIRTDARTLNITLSVRRGQRNKIL